MNLTEMLPFYPHQFLYQLPRCSLTKSDDGCNCSSGNNFPANVKLKSNSFSTSRDSEWLTLEICREYLREDCPRGEENCRYAHPSKSIYCNNGRVVCCYDYIKGRCHRYQPPCKYLHPPNHLKEQLLEKGKANLLLKGKTSILLQDQSNTNSSKINPAANWAPMQLLPQDFLQHQINNKESLSNIPPVSFIPSLPYFFISTAENHIIKDDDTLDSLGESRNGILLDKSFQTLNYLPLSRSQVPFQQYILNNNYYHGQICIKDWPSCTYPTVPY